MLRRPDSLRDELKKPLGPLRRGEELVEEVERPGIVVTVGDVVTTFFTSHGRTPEISIIDGMTQREGSVAPPSGSWDHTVEVSNPPGTLTDEIMEAIRQAAERLPQKTLIKVRGEEDLAALAAAVALPPGTRVIYGLPNEGAVVLAVTEETRAICNNVLAAMEAEPDGDTDNREEG